MNKFRLYTVIIAAVGLLIVAGSASIVRADTFSFDNGAGTVSMNLGTFIINDNNTQYGATQTFGDITITGDYVGNVATDVTATTSGFGAAVPTTLISGGSGLFTDSAPFNITAASVGGTSFVFSTAALTVDNTFTQGVVSSTIPAPEASSFVAFGALMLAAGGLLLFQKRRANLLS